MAVFLLLWLYFLGHFGTQLPHATLCYLPASLKHLLLLKYSKYSSCSIQDTYIYQGQNSDCSLRFAPVSPEQGMKWMSFLGLKPTFFKNGTSFSLHSSYLLKWQADQGKFHLFQHNTILCFKKPADISVPSVKLLCEQQASLIKPGGLSAPSPQPSSTAQHCPLPYPPSFLCSIKHWQCSPYTSVTGLGKQQHKLEVLQARDPGQHSRTDQQTPPEVMLQPGTSVLAQSPPISYTVSGGFMLFISVTLPPLSLGWIQ